MIERPVGDSGKPLKSEKEFDKEVSEIAVKLKDTQTCDWKLRTTALKRIQYFAQFCAESGVLQGSSCISFAKFIDAVTKLTAPLGV
jgi:hypothetical protein